MAKPTDDNLLDEELELEPELENVQDPPEDEVVEEEEVEEEPVQQVEEEERIPKSRFDAEKARGDTLQHVLETLQRGQQPQQQPAAQPVVDQEANLTPEDRKWREYIRQAAKPEIERRVQEVISEIKKSSIDPLNRVSIEVQDRIDEQETKRQFRDYDQFRDKVNQTRAEWYRQYGIVAPRDVAYHYVKGQQASKVAASTRTSNVRANAKQSATVSNKPPTKKVTPKSPVTLNDVANMSFEDAERWLQSTGAKF